MVKSRIEGFNNFLKEKNLDAFILFNKEYDNRPNVQYLSGFTGSYGVLLLAQKQNFLITDARYHVQAEEESDFQLVKQKDRDPWPTILGLISDLGISKLGFEEDKLSVYKYERLREGGLQLTGYRNLFMEMRSVKDKGELEEIKTACQIASEAFERFYPHIKIGMKESQLAAELTYEMRKLGAEKPVKGHFVVASGRRGQRPHGVFTDKVVEDGDFITFDFGAVYKGYVSDLTRTVGVGDVSPELVKIYGIVLEAQQKGIKAASTQHTGESLDKVVREHITSEGYGSYFTHSTGHGIGLEIHELPMVNKTNKDKLKVNSVVTMEPGVYIPNLGGVRIEDNIIIKEDGCEVISYAQKELTILKK